MSSDTTQSTGLYDFLAWLEVNKKRLLFAFLAVVLAGMVISYVRHRNQQTEIAANEALLQLRSRGSAGETAPSPSAQAFLKVASDFPSTDAADRAILLAAGASFGEGKYAEAQAEFERFLQKHPDHSLAPMAAYGKAASLEAAGKQDDALSAYQNLLTRYPRSSLADETKLSLARIHEAKKQPQLALQRYDEIINSVPPSGSAGEAMTLKEALLKVHPELAKTNAPAASATTNAVSILSTNKPANAPAVSTNR